MLNIDFVTDRVATGGDIHTDRDLAAVDIAAIVAAGITHVIDNRIEWSDQALFTELAPQIAYLHNPADDRGQRMPGTWFDRATTFALDALAQPDTKVLAHCHMGINRGPSSAYALLLAQGWDAVDAIDAIRRARPIANVLYADDALAWHHRRAVATTDVRRSDRERLAAWRRSNPLDVGGVIRRIRRAQLEDAG